jgi:hypothetical protein
MVHRTKGKTGMATVTKRSAKVGKYPASDEVLRWIESITGLLAHIRTEYGGVSELIEHPHWDSSRNNYATSMLNGLRKEVTQLAKDFNDHVNHH